MPCLAAPKNSSVTSATASGGVTPVSSKSHVRWMSPWLSQTFTESNRLKASLVGFILASTMSAIIWSASSSSMIFETIRPSRPSSCIVAFVLGGGTAAAGVSPTSTRPRSIASVVASLMAWVALSIRAWYASIDTFSALSNFCTWSRIRPGLMDSSLTASAPYISSSSPSTVAPCRVLVLTGWPLKLVRRDSITFSSLGISLSVTNWFLRSVSEMNCTACSSLMSVASSKPFPAQ